MSYKGKNNFRILLITPIANALELYDYVLYGVMVPFISNKFFPSESGIPPILFGYLSFMIAFFIAPVGSVFWGWLGDKFGRLILLRRSVLLMGLPSLGIALLPTYQEIGIVASLFVIFLRVIQGISVSGEVFGVKIFAMEHLGNKLYGTASGIISAGGAIGVLLAMFMGYLTLQFANYSEFWRIPFFIGGGLCLINFVIRRYLTESQVFKQSAKAQKDISFIDVLKNNKSNSITVFALGAILGILSYFLQVFLNPFLIKLGVDKNFAHYLTILALLVTTCTSIITGIYSDKVGKFDLLLSKQIRIMILLFIPSYLALIFGGSILRVVAFIIFGATLGIFATLSSVVMYKAFPIESRCRGVLFNYATGVALFGGATPFVLSLLAGVNPLLPGLATVIAFSIFYYIFYKFYFHR